MLRLLFPWSWYFYFIQYFWVVIWKKQQEEMKNVCTRFKDIVFGYMYILVSQKEKKKKLLWRCVQSSFESSPSSKSNLWILWIYIWCELSFEWSCVTWRLDTFLRCKLHEHVCPPPVWARPWQTSSDWVGVRAVLGVLNGTERRHLVDVEPQPDWLLHNGNKRFLLQSLAECHTYK